MKNKTKVEAAVAFVTFVGAVIFTALIVMSGGTL